MKDEMTAKELAIECGYSIKKAEEYYSHLKNGKLNEEDKKIQAKLDDYLFQKAQKSFSIIDEKRKNETVF